MHHTLYIKNELCELSRVFEFIERNLPSCLSDKRKLSQVKLAIEELVANVIMYAYGERKDQDIQIEMECRGDTVASNGDRLRHSIQSVGEQRPGFVSVGGRATYRRIGYISGQAIDDGAKIRTRLGKECTDND